MMYILLILDYSHNEYYIGLVELFNIRLFFLDEILIIQ